LHPLSRLDRDELREKCPTEFASRSVIGHRFVVQTGGEVVCQVLAKPTDDVKVNDGSWICERLPCLLDRGPG
jgi:hypothetical protein